MRTRSARLVCILTIFTDFRRHRRAGGGVVGIDGPPPSRRALSLSLSLPPSFPSIPLAPSVTVSFSLSPCVASPALSHETTVRGSLSLSAFRTFSRMIRRFRDSGMRHAGTLARSRDSTRIIPRQAATHTHGRSYRHCARTRECYARMQSTILAHSRTALRRGERLTLVHEYAIKYERAIARTFAVSRTRRRRRRRRRRRCRGSRSPRALSACIRHWHHHSDRSRSRSGRAKLSDFIRMHSAPERGRRPHTRVRQHAPARTYTCTHKGTPLRSACACACACSCA